MIRNNSRSLTRLFFLLVLVAALFGGWYAQRSFQLQPTGLSTTALPADADWVDITSTVAEELIQFFFGLSGAGR